MGVVTQVMCIVLDAFRLFEVLWCRPDLVGEEAVVEETLHGKKRPIA